MSHVKNSQSENILLFFEFADKIVCHPFTYFGEVYTMSMLEKFKKAGGFQQLVQIIEICDPTKQKSMLQLVGTEDPGWAHLVKIKSLSFEKIIQWPHLQLMEVFFCMEVLQLAVLYQNTPATNQDNILKALHPHLIREVQDQAMKNSFSSEQLFAAKVRLIQAARECLVSGRLDPANFDPTLIIESKIAG